MKYKFRQIKPVLANSNWIEREAEDIGEAIQNHHFEEAIPIAVGSMCSCLHCLTTEMPCERIHVRVYEDKEGNKYPSKIYTSGIYRKGAVKPKISAQEQREIVAKEIGMTVEELLFDNWSEL